MSSKNYPFKQHIPIATALCGLIKRNKKPGTRVRMSEAKPAGKVSILYEYPYTVNKEKLTDSLGNSEVERLKKHHFYYFYPVSNSHDQVTCFYIITVVGKSTV
jgi:hypothetical protein